jgi:NADPH:quinone reductase-like Zn-dependent oxidoreductase
MQRLAAPTQCGTRALDPKSWGVSGIAGPALTACSLKIAVQAEGSRTCATCELSSLTTAAREVITAIEENIPTPKVGEVRVKVLAAGVSLPDVLAREGVHPETPRVPYTPGWDLVGTVDQLGEGVTGFELRQTVAAMPIHGCYAQYCIQWLMRFKPAWFRHDLLTLLDLLQQGKIRPLIAQRLPLQEARRAHEMLGQGGVLGRIVLPPNG